MEDGYTNLYGGASDYNPADASCASIQKRLQSQTDLLTDETAENIQPKEIQQNISTSISPFSPLRFKDFRKILPYLMIFEFAFYLKYVFIAAYGAAWFGGCRTIKENDNCNKTFQYDEFNLWNNGMISALCFIAFLTSAFVGTLSDSYGRKPFILFQVINTIIQYLYMILWDNFFVFFGLGLLIGFNGTALPTGPVTSAIIADILPQEHRIMGFAYYYILAGFGLGTSAVAGYFIAFYMGDHFNFYIISGMFALSLIYVIFFFPETLPKEKRKRVNKKIFGNPFLPLMYMKKNPVVRWMAFLYLFLTLPDSGITNIVIPVFSDALNSDTADKSNMIALLYLGGMTVGLIFAPFCVLPLLKKFFITDYKVLIVSTILLGISLVLLVLVIIFKQVWMVAVVGFALAHAYLCLTAGGSILAEYTPEQDRGEAFGCVGAMANIAGIVAPSMFAWIYHYSREYNVQFIVYVVAVVMVIFALWMVLVPFKKALDEVKNNKEKYGLVPILEDLP